VILDIAAYSNCESWEKALMSPDFMKISPGDAIEARPVLQRAWGPSPA
jgi:hypothetical protein